MKIKSLLLGSAAALVAVSGARAADAIVAAEPEPVEYVRVCGAFGTGYFYIPGTETCLKIGGYVRYELNMNRKEQNLAPAGPETAAALAARMARRTADGYKDFGKRSEVRLNIEASNETELGTLYSRVRLGYDANPQQDGDQDLSGFAIDHAVITLGGLMVGKNASWWDWGFGQDGDGMVSYGPGEMGMFAYTYRMGATAISLAVEEDNNGNYTPDVIFDVVTAVGSFNLHGAVAYDEAARAATAKAMGSFALGMATIGLGVQWSDGSARNGSYTASHEWILGAEVAASLTEKLSARAGFDYGIDNVVANDWTAGAGINYKFVSGFDVDARVNYRDSTENFGGRLRLTRSF